MLNDEGFGSMTIQQFPAMACAPFLLLRAGHAA